MTAPDDGNYKIAMADIKVTCLRQRSWMARLPICAPQRDEQLKVQP